MLSAHTWLIVAICTVPWLFFAAVLYLIERARDDDDPGHEPGPGYAKIAR